MPNATHVFLLGMPIFNTMHSDAQALTALFTGGTGDGDDVAELLKATWRETRRSVLHRGGMAEFHFRQYLFACQARVLLKLNCGSEVH